MNVQHILNRGRQLAESLMTDQCRVTHMGKPVTDPETGLVEPAANTVCELTEAADPNLKGRKLRLLNMQSEKSHATACRWNVKEVGNSNE